MSEPRIQTNADGHTLDDTYIGNVRCNCGETINPASPYVQVEADGVLWHGNADGGGHRADFK